MSQQFYIPVHQLVTAQAERAPYSIAIRGSDESLVYIDLEKRSNQLANALRKHGVGLETMVAIALPKSVDAVVAILAVLKTGAAYVPLDPDHPIERVEQILDDTRPALLLARKDFPGRLRARTRAVAMDTDEPEWITASAEPLEETSCPNSLAYVIYTSGSSGRPKGVCIEHGGLSNLIQAQIEAFAIRPDSCVLQFSSLVFDASVSEVFTALCAGATLRIAKSQELIPGPPLLATLRDGVSVATLPPSLLAVLPDANLSGLETVVSAGERCPDAVVERWSRGRKFINAYGPTESTVCATFSHANSEASGAIIGSSLSGVSTHVLDVAGEPTPIGVNGELFVGGNGVARGYLNQPDLTAEYFVPDPFASKPGQRLYRTGDIVRRLASGDLEFRGRRDRQLKIRGFRIEPGEIEETLRRHEAVANAVVIGYQNGTSDTRLVCYVVPRGPRAPISSLQSSIRTSLPEYLVPEQFMWLSEIPLTPNGKVDLKSLPGIDRDGTKAVEPRTAIEQALAQIWCEALGLNSVSVTDDFFEIGGQSIAAVRVIAGIEEIWGQSVPISELLAERTIERLAGVIQRDRPIPQRGGQSPIIKIQPHGLTPPLILCHAIGGSPLCYLKLARQLDDQQVWGLESPMLYGSSPPSSMAAAASDLADSIVESTDGPYILGGWSFGGILAFEVALELERRRKRVDTVFLFDPGPPRAMENDDEDLLEMVTGFAHRTGLPFDRQFYASLEGERQLHAIEQSLTESMPPTTAAALTRELRTAAVNIGLRRDFVPSGKSIAAISLFQAIGIACEQASRARADALEWAGLTRQPLEVTNVSSSHGAILREPHVSIVAERILRRHETKSRQQD